MKCINSQLITDPQKISRLDANPSASPLILIAEKNAFFLSCRMAVMKKFLSMGESGFFVCSFCFLLVEVDS